MNTPERLAHDVHHIFSQLVHPPSAVCGRGGGSNNHPGNENFRELVNEVKFPYVNCPKREKPLIARRIVEAVRNQTPPGRFLIKDVKGLWNDIGDGRAREKTSQALREGAPIIRDMVRGPTEPTDVATAVKEAKKAERAEKEYSANNLPENLVSNKESDHMSAQATANTPSKIEPCVFNCEVGSKGPVVMNRLKVTKFQGEVAQPTAVWPPAPPQALMMFNPGMHYPHYASHVMEGYVAPGPPIPIKYCNRPPPRHPDSVPHETVRRLLLGQIDPVGLALHLLSPQEAAIVACRHNNSNVLVNTGPGVNDARMIDPQRPPIIEGRGSSSGSSSRDIVSEASSRSSSGDCIMRRSPSDTSSVASSSKQSSSDTPTKRALPKKKRKYIEESSDV